MADSRPRGSTGSSGSSDSSGSSGSSEYSDWSGSSPSETNPLAGTSVVVTRAEHQAGPLITGLRGVGATVVLAPAIEVVDPDDGGAALRRAVADAVRGRYRWVVVTSANGADRLVQSLAVTGSEWPGDQVGLASVGPATTRALEVAGLDVAIEAHEAIGDSLVERFAGLDKGDDEHGPGKVLVARAQTGRPTVPEGLAAQGWEVELVAAYAVVATSFDEFTRHAIAEADVITFASGRTAEFIVAQCGVDNLPAIVVCIGPVAAAAAGKLGLSVSQVANPHTTEGMIEAVMESRR